MPISIAKLARNDTDRKILRFISSIRARRVSIDGGSAAVPTAAGFLLIRDDIEPEWLPYCPPLFNAQVLAEVTSKKKK